MIPLVCGRKDKKPFTWVVGIYQITDPITHSRVCIISEPAGYLHIFLWLDMDITSSEFGQRLLVTMWFYCVSGFATSVVNCGTTRVPKGLPM
jgi:hypothetical protein